MNTLDSKGTYRFQVLDAAVVTTKKGFPQWVATLAAVEKYVEDAADIEHFQKQNLLMDGQPGWVDWSAFKESITGYFVMFNSAEAFITEGPGKTTLMNYEQMQIALGWDGTEFESLADGSQVNKIILGRVDENEYQGKTSLQVNWLDAADASPTRILKNLDAASLKGLTAKLKINATKKPVAPAKPATPVAKPAVAPASKPAPAAKLPAAQTPAASAAAPATTPVPALKSPSKPGPKEVTEYNDPGPGPALPTTCDQMGAWETVQACKGTNEDSVIQEAWIAACAEVGGDKDEAQFTPSDWAKIRDVVIRDCALSVAA